jgi:hypothetical protein
MRFILVLILLISLSLSLFAQNFDYTSYNLLLEKYVKGNQFDYHGLINDKNILIKFTDLLGEKSPDSHPADFPNDADKLAYWINAYNAFILKIIVENYPLESIKDINFIGFTVWLDKNLIGGKEISFKSLEDDIIRERFADPRIHFAINCASASCPPLAASAFLPAKLEQQLEERTNTFINNADNFFVDEENQTIYMSSIFDWYNDDFLNWLQKKKRIKDPDLLDYIDIYLKDGIDSKWRSYDQKFNDYDWSLNDINR